MKLGVTGSIGSGKTTVAGFFRKHGFKIINADKLYHKISKPGTKIYRKILKEFGMDILDSRKYIDRKKLKKIVYKDHKKLLKLNKITHPLIIDGIEKLMGKSKNVVVDAPLLMEANAAGIVDLVIVVKCRKNVQVSRVLKKRKHTKIEVLNILKSQMPLKKKVKYADFVIDNSTNLKALERKVNGIVSKVKQ